MAKSRTFLPLGTKQCDKMLEYEKGCRKEKAGVPVSIEEASQPVNWRPSRAAAGFRSGYGLGGGATGLLDEGLSGDGAIGFDDGDGD
jgi:hypothetical protein